ncbi:MAG TPA: type IV pili twitching motility protein PilT, partial [Anaeromyxobacteraceae bacterium]|nr:type IV pili twitching motility protein PilT [Anaeromyxobacteraceae bacterium]
YQQKQVRLQLGTVLRAVISQRLVPKADGKGRVPAIEVLLATSRVTELIEDKDRTKEIPDAISQGHVSYGMQTFDQSLMTLLKQGLITYEEALRQATNADDFALRVSGVSGTSDSKWDSFEKPLDAPAVTPRPATTPARPPAQPLGRVGVQTRPPVAPGARPVGGGQKPGGDDDDFQIERF